MVYAIEDNGSIIATGVNAPDSTMTTMATLTVAVITYLDLVGGEGGGEIFFPHGFYYYATPSIYITTNNLYIHGDGNSYLIGSGANTMFYIQGSYITISNFIFGMLMPFSAILFFDGIPIGAGGNLYPLSAQNLRITNVTFDSSGSAVTGTGCQNVFIDGNSLFYCRGGFQFIADTPQNIGITITNNKFANSNDDLSI